MLLKQEEKSDSRDVMPVTSIKDLSEGIIQRLSVVHEKALPESIFAILGREFLSRYFYREVIKNQGLFCKVFEVDSRIAGFIVFTNNSSDVFKQQIKRHPLLISTLLIKSIFGKIDRLKFILLSIYFLFKQQKRILPHISSEIVSFAVLPEYRVHYIDNSTGIASETEFYKKTRIRIAEELFKSCEENLKNQDKKEIKIMTEINNAGSNKFYRKMGCEPVALRERVFGLDVNFYVKKIN